MKSYSLNKNVSINNISFSSPLGLITGWNSNLFIVSRMYGKLNFFLFLLIVLTVSPKQNFIPEEFAEKIK